MTPIVSDTLPVWQQQISAAVTSIDGLNNQSKQQLSEIDELMFFFNSKVKMFSFTVYKFNLFIVLYYTKSFAEKTFIHLTLV